VVVNVMLVLARIVSGCDLVLGGVCGEKVFVVFGLVGEDDGD
jgi:hypothetical protein